MRKRKLRQQLGEFILPLICLGFVGGCRSLPEQAQPSSPPPMVRFLLTFDDGPSIRRGYNPTLSIVDQLATNDVQRDIKALFFVQTGHPRGGGTPEGRAIMQRVAREGHVLGLHSVSPRGHVSHTAVTEQELDRSLREAKELLWELTGAEPALVRPPFGAWNAQVAAVYARLNLHTLMSDIRARDGIIYGYNASVSRRLHIRFALQDIRKRLATDNARASGACQPIIVQFHDVNPYTARHMTEYLHILVEEAQRAGLDLAELPFYGTPQEVVKVGLSRQTPATMVAGRKAPHSPQRGTFAN
jgi:peptidoglycan/xylan/chitin deacetylase (PgdA/CDA1 family)